MPPRLSRFVKHVHTQDTGANRADHAKGGHYGQPHYGVSLAADTVAIQIFAHFLDCLADIPINPISVEMSGQHPKQILGLSLVGNFMKPVTVGEAEKGLEDPADFSLEGFDRSHVTNIELADRCDQPFRKQHQRGFMKMRDQVDQKILVTELS